MIYLQHLKKKKNKIIEELYRNYCGVNLNYDAPFFARGNKEQYGAETETKNNTPLELTEKIIKKAVDSDIRKNERNKTYKILNAPEKKDVNYFWNILIVIKIYVWILFILE